MTWNCGLALRWTSEQRTIEAEYTKKWRIGGSSRKEGDGFEWEIDCAHVGEGREAADEER